MFIAKMLLRRHLYSLQTNFLKDNFDRKTKEGASVEKVFKIYFFQKIYSCGAGTYTDFGIFSAYNTALYNRVYNLFCYDYVQHRHNAVPV